MKPFIQNIIVPHQASFIKGRRACDNTVIIQEVMNYMKNSKSKNGNMVVKIDLEKAFDKLEWSFIHRTLTFFNFPSKMINLIMSCITSSSYTILVNGFKSESFILSRGIRQGDPMSPTYSSYVWRYY